MVDRCHELLDALRTCSLCRASNCTAWVLARSTASKARCTPPYRMVHPDVTVLIDAHVVGIGAFLGTAPPAAFVHRRCSWGRELHGRYVLRRHVQRHEGGEARPGGAAPIEAACVACDVYLDSEDLRVCCGVPQRQQVAPAAAVRRVDERGDGA